MKNYMILMLLLFPGIYSCKSNADEVNQLKIKSQNPIPNDYDSTFLELLNEFDLGIDNTSHFLIRLIIRDLNNSRINAFIEIRQNNQIDSFFVCEYKEKNSMFYGISDSPSVTYKRLLFNIESFGYPIDSMQQEVENMNFFNLSRTVKDNEFPLFEYYLEIYEGSRHNLIYRESRFNEQKTFTIAFNNLISNMLKCIGINTELIKKVVFELATTKN